MALFAPDNHRASPRHARIYALYEVAHTVVDFTAALLFLVGSAMFFSEHLRVPATWCFLVGSVAFALKPTLRLAREIHYLQLGDYGAVAGDEVH